MKQLKKAGKGIIATLIILNFIGMVYVNLPLEWQVEEQCRKSIYCFFDISLVVFIFEMALRISFNKNFFSERMPSKLVRNWFDFLLLIFTIVFTFNYHFEGMGLRILTLGLSGRLYHKIWDWLSCGFQINKMLKEEQREKFQYENELRRFVNIIILVNVLAYCVLNSETVMNAKIGVGFNIILTGINIASVIVFSIEMVIRLKYYKWEFFKSFWNCFDLFVTLISVVGIGYYFYARIINLSRYAKSFQALRQFNIAKVFAVDGKMRETTNAMLRSLPSIGWVAFYFLFLFVIYGALGHDLFAKTAEFNTLRQSFISLFQIMTFDNWSIIMNHASTCRTDLPSAIITVYFFSFIIIASYILLSAVTGIIVHYVEDTTKGEEEKLLDEKLDNIKQQLDSIQEFIKNK